MDVIFHAKKTLDWYWGGEIPVDVKMIAERMGVQVYFVDYIGDAGDDISGSFEYINDIPICKIRNSDALVRQRFSLAHELGHFVLNHGSAFRDNSASFNTNNCDYKEVEANQFAIEILMPKTELIYATKHTLSIRKLAHQFYVSGIAMELRLAELGFIISN